MLYLRSWLADYINLESIDEQTLVNTITLKSGEVDEVKKIADWFGNKVVVGRIENIQKHPDADKLNVFDVNIGASKVQIVSAASNVRDGLIVPIALVGAKLASMIVVERKMRGITSQGMCCGKSELMLETEYSSGLWELPDTLENSLGTSICKVFPELFPVDTVYDIKYNPDKFASCGSHLGLALEIATVLENHNLLTELGKRLLNLDTILSEYELIEKMPISSEIQIRFQDTANYCHSFNVLRLRLKQEYTLDHKLQQRMFFLDKGAIGGLADLSNYLMYDVGNPTNFFSTDKVRHQTPDPNNIDWVIEQTTELTYFTGLGNLKNTTLPVGLSVMKSGKEILTLPGISVGESTKLNVDDTDVLIETANFVGEKVARSSFQTNYRSDASRFLASDISQHLIKLTTVRYLEILNDKIDLCERVINFERDKLNTPYSFEVNIDYIAQRLDHRGGDYWKPIIEKKLVVMGTYDSSTKTFTPNPFFGTCNTTEKILERVACLIGFDNLSEDHLQFSSGFTKDEHYNSLTLLKILITEFGAFEIVSRPFLAKADIQNTDAALTLLSTHNTTLNYLQDSLQANLLKAISRNIVDGEKHPKLFEHTKLYTQVDNKLIEKLIISVAIIADSPYLATSLCHTVTEKTGIVDIEIVEISNKIKKQYSIPLNKTVWMINIDLTNWNGSFQKYEKYTTQSEYPSIKRTLSIEVDPEKKWSEIEQKIPETQTSDVIIKVEPVERFNTGETDKITFELTFTSYDRTLENEEVDKLIGVIIK